MNISRAEQSSIRRVLEAGRDHGYGNMIAHLQTAWAKSLMDDGMSEEGARHASGGAGYPFALQADLVEHGRWDETGASYQKAKK